MVSSPFASVTATLLLALVACSDDSDPSATGTGTGACSSAGGRQLSPRSHRGQRAQVPAGYGCGEGGADATCAMPEVGGELELPGGVYLISTSNVN